MTSGGHDLVAVGASWGGLDALRTLLRDLPATLDAAVVVAQHRAVESRSTLRDLLGAAGALTVCEPADKDELRPGTLYVAAPDYHLLVEGNRLALSTDEPVLYARPSIDVLLETAAESFRERCVGLILTGANTDGSRGLARIVELGGTAVVQDPLSAEREEMPRAALASVPGAVTVPLDEIASLLVELCGLAKVPS
jgi:two-component system, chemotaxis family, protein-glutamate methylesterase/glutaminase